jgi:hypothetical protein
MHIHYPNPLVCELPNAFIQLKSLADAGDLSKADACIMSIGK